MRTTAEPGASTPCWPAGDRKERGEAVGRGRERRPCQSHATGDKTGLGSKLSPSCWRFGARMAITPSGFILMHQALEPLPMPWCTHTSTHILFVIACVSVLTPSGVPLYTQTQAAAAGRSGSAGARLRRVGGHRLHLRDCGALLAAAPAVKV